MRLHLVRHGQTDWNAKRRIQGQLESELDETGRQQATARGKDFISIDLLAVYSSSSVRTRQTTSLLLGERSDPVVYRDDLREVCLGVWQGHYWEDIEKQFPTLVEAHSKASPDFNVEGAETSLQVQQRGIGAIESIVDLHANATQNDDVLVVSHGAIMKTILAYYLDIPLTEMHHYPSLPNCAHCIIDVSPPQRKVVSIAGQTLVNGQWGRLESIGDSQIVPP